MDPNPPDYTTPENYAGVAKSTTTIDFASEWACAFPILLYDSLNESTALKAS
jgi:hypothetical protein